MSESDKGAFWRLADVITKVGTSVRQAAASIQATVSHVDDDGTVWVQPDGIDRELPVSTAYAEGSEGDRVRVTIEDGQAYVEGNATTPAVGKPAVERAVEPVAKAAAEAAKTATRYVAELVNGILVHPEGDTTTGVRITDAIELVRNSIDYLRLWISDADVPLIRVGRADAAHVIVGDSTVEIETQRHVKSFSVSGDGATRTETRDVTVGTIDLGIRVAPGMTLAGQFTIAEGATHVDFTVTKEVSGESSHVTQRVRIESRNFPVSSACLVRMVVSGQTCGITLENSSASETFELSATRLLRYETISVKTPALRFGSWYGESGPYSVALGEGVKAEGDRKVALGRYNVDDPDNILEVGDGTGDLNRLNVLALDAFGALTLMDGDGELVAHVDESRIDGPLKVSRGGTGKAGVTEGTVTRGGVDASAGTVKVTDNGLVVELAASQLNLKNELASGSSVTLLTLPAGYRPDMYRFALMATSSATYAGRCMVRVGTGGAVTLYNASGSAIPTTLNVNFSLSWIHG